MIQLTDRQIKIMEGKICPYCDGEAKLVSSLEVYTVDYGKLWLCKPCDAYVGCHKGTEKALGRLANPSLRKWKIEAHKYFDMLWKLKFMKRGEAYLWLSKMVGTPLEYTHIGMFSEKTLKDVVFFSKQFMNDMRRLDLDYGAKPKTNYFEL